MHYSYSSGLSIGYINARDSVFYKLGLYSGQTIYGYFDRCIFNQCGINFASYNYFSGWGDIYSSYKNCVFLGNSFVDQTNPNHYNNSSMGIRQTAAQPSVDGVYYSPETGTTYLQVSSANGLEQKFLAETLDMETVPYVILESAEEGQTLARTRFPDGQYGSGYSRYYDVGIRYDRESEEYIWSDGSAVDSWLDPDGLMAKGNQKLYLRLSKNYKYDENANYVYDNGGHVYEYGCKLTTSSGDPLYEIPGQILPEDITFREYTVDMDLESTYQLAPQNTPVQLTADAFRYESDDESVITVSDKGLVTPVGLGAADVWVWSMDKAVRNRVTFTVKEYVPLEGLQLQTAVTEVAVGENLALQCNLTPMNTTRNNVTFTTSDASIARVDIGGIVTGVASGKVTITATCEGFTDTVELTIYQKTKSLQLDNVALSAALEDAAVALPQVVTDSGAEPVLSWRSTDPSVAAVEDGKLVLKTTGTTSIIVTDRRSGLSAACLVMVSQGKTNPVRKIVFGSSYGNKWVLLEEGSLYVWNNNGISEPRLATTGVQAVAADDHNVLVLKANGVLERWYASGSVYRSATISQFSGRKIKDIELHSDNNIWVCTEDGNAYAMGNYNSSGQLAIGSTQTVTEPILINVDGVVDIENYSEGTWLLTDKGELYAAGALSYTTTAEPVLIDTEVSQILSAESSYGCYYVKNNGKLTGFFGSHGEGNRYYTYNDLSDLEQVAYRNSYIIGIREGKVYTGYRGETLTPVVGISNAVTVATYNNAFYVGTADGLLLGFGNNPVGNNYMAGMTIENPVKSPVIIPLVRNTAEELAWTAENLTDGLLTEDSLRLTFCKALASVSPKLYADGDQITFVSEIKDYNHLEISRTNGFAEGVQYQLVFAPKTIQAAGGVTNAEEIRIAFTYQPSGEDAPETDGDTTKPTEEKVVYEAILDETVQRYWTTETLQEKATQWNKANQLNGNFYGNAILNPISTDFEVSHWLRIQAPEVTVGEYSEIPLGGNYWGSVNDRAIGLQLIDYTDFPNYARLMYAPFLQEAPENTFPFVTSVKLFNKYGEEVTTVGNEEVKFQVKFNRDMDTSIDLLVRFGSAYPYGDYEIEGQYVDARTWEGTYTLNTLIENGYQYFSISNGCSATEDLPLQWDQYRFFFEIDTTAAQALIMQGTALDTGVELKWTQDDFQTLMGYNVYRSTKEDGLYTRLNSTVIPASTMTFFDDTVEPGVVYYYNFTVVQTDMAESEPSGKIVIMSKDTMAPDIYHSPVSSAFTGANLVLTATVTDNLNISYANLYYRVTGTEEWNTIRMNKLNDKYSAIIPAQYVTVDGIEYYIEAFDGVSFTYKGKETPYTVAVQEALDENSLGDVDGDGVITNLDALKLLYTINDKYNMTAEEFARADLNGDGELWAAEALRILQYVSGVVGSVKM